MARLFTVKVRLFVVIAASVAVNATAGYSQGLIRTVALENAHERNVTDGFSFGAPFLNNNGSVLFARGFSTVEFVEEEFVKLETGEICTSIRPVSTVTSRTLILAPTNNALLNVTQSQGFPISFSQVALNAADEAVFLTPGENGGVFRTTSNGTQQLLIDGTSVPTEPAGTQFSFPLLGVSTSNGGQIAFLLNMRGPGIQLNINSRAIYRENASGNPELVAQKNVSTTSGSGELVTGTFSDPVLNDTGEIYFSAGLVAEDSGFRSGLLSQTEGGPLEVVYRAGDPVLVDGESATVGSGFSTPAVNDSGIFALRASVSIPGETTRTSLFVANENVFKTIATVGDLAVGTTGEIRYRSVSSQKINNDGDVVFTASLHTLESPFAPRGTGLYTYGEDQALKLIARTREGEEAVGTDGKFFTVIYQPQLNQNGQVAFVASLSDSGSGIFGLDTAGELQLVVAKGDTIDIGDADNPDFRTLRSVGFASGNRTTNNGFNDQGQVAFSAVFTDGTTGVFVSDRLVSPPIILGDCNLDGEVTFLDIAPFIGFLSSYAYLEQADCNQDDEVSFLDIAPFLAILIGN